MRWQTEIVSKETSTQESEKFTTEITVTKRNKVQYITIGDIVAMGKSAAGAVGSLARKLPSFIGGLKADGSFPQSIALATALNGIVQPLAIMVQGLEIYKTVMSVIDVLTPIMKTIARASGVWCSPGNVADLAQIALGTVQQILIGIAISAIIKLKNWVWSLEFPIRRIPMDDMKTINKKAKEMAEWLKNHGSKNPGSMIGPDGKPLYVDPMDMENYRETNEDIKKKVLDLLGKNGSDTAAVDMDKIMSKVFGDEPKDSAKIAKGYNSKNNYITEFHPDGKEEKIRMLGGSDHNTGIYYSDDKGKTWTQSKQTTGTFIRFAKIPVADKPGEYIYVAGSGNYIQTLKRIKSDAKEFSRNEFKHYNKDYYKKVKGEIFKLSKNDKYKLEKKYSNFNNIIMNDRAMEADSSIDGKGIYYSEDNGITWMQSNIKDGSYGLFFEYKEKVGHKPTIVGSSYDYKGVLYTEDGKKWIRSKIKGMDIVSERWTRLSDSIGTDPKVVAKDLYIRTKIGNSEARIVKTASAVEKIGIKMKISAYVGEGLEDVDGPLGLMIKETVRRMHDTAKEILKNEHVDVLIDKDEKFWEDHINMIKKGEYTFEDAKNGRDLRKENTDAN